MLRIVTPRRLAVAAFVLCLAGASQARAQSAQSYGSPQGVVPSAQGYVAAAADCGDTGGHHFSLPKLPKFGHGKTVCRVPAGTVCEPAPADCGGGCGFKMPKLCMPKIHMPKVCLPKIKMPKLCHKSACDSGCGGGCGETWAAPVSYASPQGFASPQGVASPQG